MFAFIVWVALFVGVSASDLLEPKFQVLSADELMVKVPHYGGAKLVTFRIGVKRLDRELEDLERGENSIDDDQLLIYDERLNLKEGDVVNYLLAFRDSEGNYRAQTGNYVFNGVYHKKPYNNHRRRRENPTSTTDSVPNSTMDDDEEGTTNVDLESRFGFGTHYNPHGRRPDYHGRRPDHHGRRPDYHGNYPDFHGGHHGMSHPPPFGGQHWGHGGGYHPSGYPHPPQWDCNQCRAKCWPENQKQPPMPRPPPTSTEFPDIDIRFSDD